MAWSVPRTWNPGETVTATLMNAHVRDNLNVLKTYFSDTGVPSGFLKTAYQTADVTKNANVTPGDLTGLNFAVAAGENWLFVCLLRGISVAAADFRFAFTGPSAPTSVMYGCMSGNGPLTSGAATAFGSNIQCAAVAFDEPIILLGHLRNGANAGTVQAQFSQATSNASNSVIYANSVLFALRLL